MWAAQEPLQREMQHLFRRFLREFEESGEQVYRARMRDMCTSARATCQITTHRPAPGPFDIQVPLDPWIPLPRPANPMSAPAYIVLGGTSYGSTPFCAASELIGRSSCYCIRYLGGEI